MKVYYGWLNRVVLTEANLITTHNIVLINKIKYVTTPHHISKESISGWLTFYHIAKHPTLKQFAASSYDIDMVCKITIKIN